jgi:hypothetical protein
MASFVVKHKNLNIKNITFSDVKQTKMGGSNIYLRYKNPTTSQEHNLYVQTPKMFCPFGASSYKQTDSTQLPRYNMNLSFGKDKPELKKFQDKLAALDELVLDKVLNDPKLLALLNIKSNKDKDKTRAGLSFLQVPTIKFPKDDTKDYPPVLSVKIPTNFSTGKFTTEFYNKQKEKMEVDHDNIEMCCPKKSEVKCLLRVASIWFVGGKFGVALRAEQSVVFPSQALSGYAFADDSDDEQDQEVASALKSGVVLSDTEDEDEDEDEEEEVVEEDEEEEDEVEVEEEGPVLSEDSEEEVEEPEPPKPKRGRRKTTGSKTRSRKKN